MKNILITGVSTGIGDATADACVRKGYRVFGTIRKESDAERCLQKWGSSFIPIIMDVRDGDSIKRGAEIARDKLRGEKLHVLINNSGIAKAAPLELQSPDEIREILEVNVMGLIRVIQLFLPLMRRKSDDHSSPSKIINISSGAGKIGIPFLGAYVASKHAVEGLSHSLRRELLPWGIDVVVVGPGNVVTPIWDKAIKDTVFEESSYSSVFKRFFEHMVREGNKGMTPQEIAHVILSIIESKETKVRYAPVAQKFANWYLPRLLPDRTMDKMLFKMLGMKEIQITNKNITP